MLKDFVLVCEEEFHSNKFLRIVRMMLPGRRGCRECWRYEFQILSLRCYILVSKTFGIL